MSGPCRAANAATSLAESWAGSWVTHSTVTSGSLAPISLLKSAMNGFQAAPLSYQMTTLPLGPTAAAGPAAPPRMATTARTVTKARVRRIPPLLDRLRVDGPTATDECPTIQAEPVDDNRASAKGGRAAVPAGLPEEGDPGGADQRQQG